MAKTALVAGATGLIGRALVQQLLSSDEYNEVKVFVRNKFDIAHPKLVPITVDFNHLEWYASDIRGDVFFSCLGSTKIKTPDEKEYYKIDHDYPLTLARIASANHVNQFHLISSIGANAGSKIFYIRMKGETERDIAKIPFKSIYIYRPSFLSGNRKEKRIMEKIGLVVWRIINPLLVGKFKKYRSISDDIVATAMLKNAERSITGVHIYESDQIHMLAKQV